jgi:ribosomal protein S19E (S16A)
MKLYYKWLNLITSKNSLLKKINNDKITLEIVMIIYDYDIRNKLIKSTDTFLDQNPINASRSKKISIIQNLEKEGIITRHKDKKDNRSKNIKLSENIKQKLKEYLE